MSEKIKSPADLTKLQIREIQKLGLRVDHSLPKSRDGSAREILVCVGGGCLASGALEICKAFKQAIADNDLAHKATLVETGCMGPCAAGPVAKIMPDNVFYQGITAEDAKTIVEQHIMQGQIVSHLLHKDAASGKPVADIDDIEYFKRQNKVVLRNCGNIDPFKITEYIATKGYQALAKAVSSMSSEEVVNSILESGLRGRGGGGFPTGLKWKFTREAESDIKSVVCNADEGDPGAFMDRSVLEGDPHSVIEGMSIAGYAVGAARGYVYCRAEYPIAIERLQRAINQARDIGLLGENILGTQFCFDLEIRMGSGAFVCGEETALMTSIEGNRGEPRPRPPFPAIKGLWGKPTLLNNVETFASIPVIISDGAEKYAELGTEKSKGTKVFALAGAVNNTGLVEVPIGISLGELLYDIGGGMIDGKPFKAAQLGGPSGGCIPKEHLNVALDYESLNELGAIMGSGGLIVMDEESCMVDVARFFLEFVQEESCGKCTPCRVGTKRLLEILERICDGKGEEGDIEKLISLGNQIKETALCGLGKTAANPVLSTIRHFRVEYEEHIREKKCRAGVCAGLVRAPCQSACPASVDVPGFVSLVGEKRYADALKLHRERNPFAAACARICFHACEEHCRRSSLDSPISIRGIKRFMVEQEMIIQVPECKENAKNASKKIAIIGAGPAGLSCAYFLARLGYKPKVFDSSSRPGGMMAQTIPSYRLPREILAREIRMIERLGVDIECDRALGRDFTFESLKADGYEAVFLAVGAPDGLMLGLENEDAEGVTEAISFLREYNVRGSVPVGKDVVIIGGGNAAIDAARTATRLDAKTVTVLYRRTREQMPAYEEEIEEAEAEGVKLQLLTSPEEIVVENGHVVGIRCKPMELGAFDRSGRRRPVAGEDKDFIVPCDQVIVAIGQSVDLPALSGNYTFNLQRNGYLSTDALTKKTSKDWIFAGGDVATGPSSVIEAVADGEKAAAGIDQFLTGKNNAFWREEKRNNTFFDPDAEPVMYEREKQPLIPVERRRCNFDEVEQPWDEATAIRQAKRCLRCDYREEVHTW
ncbi:NADH-ubiquinone oxidoreductase-F iron-sulfur binding region domain-containing protein [Pontiella sulfatireligans]|uniref:NADP-reducing hydrogenase subunit HndC n=1 Tax=Pontiella sulfatireligans TaxID=2750658 RepID=A0A6C2USD2_9BACT|nr:NADH-ubiquinone oxidoreductase-F iron-sulfur binding region domain-containing protein [Pontiella sulfatireligans]VGO22161.1 NADP-reducing hydrogenase subunit HndC [Pontiella sulfatireligans]